MAKDSELKKDIIKKIKKHSNTDFSKEKLENLANKILDEVDEFSNGTIEKNLNSVIKSKLSKDPSGGGSTSTLRKLRFARRIFLAFKLFALKISILLKSLIIGVISFFLSLLGMLFGSTFFMVGLFGVIMVAVIVIIILLLQPFNVPLFLTNAPTQYNIPSLDVGFRVDDGISKYENSCDDICDLECNNNKECEDQCFDSCIDERADYLDSKERSALNLLLNDFEFSFNDNNDVSLERTDGSKDIHVMNDIHTNLFFYNQMGENNFFNQRMVFPEKELQRFDLNIKDGTPYIVTDNLEILSLNKDKEIEFFNAKSIPDYDLIDKLLKGYTKYDGLQNYLQNSINNYNYEIRPIQKEIVFNHLDKDKKIVLELFDEITISTYGNINKDYNKYRELINDYIEYENEGEDVLFDFLISLKDEDIELNEVVKKDELIKNTNYQNFTEVLYELEKEGIINQDYDLISLEGLNYLLKSKTKYKNIFDYFEKIISTLDYEINSEQLLIREPLDYKLEIDLIEQEVTLNGSNVSQNISNVSEEYTKSFLPYVLKPYENNLPTFSQEFRVLENPESPQINNSNDITYLNLEKEIRSYGLQIKKDNKGKPFLSIFLNTSIPQNGPIRKDIHKLFMDKNMDPIFNMDNESIKIGAGRNDFIEKFLKTNKDIEYNGSKSHFDIVGDEILTKDEINACILKDSIDDAFMNADSFITEHIIEDMEKDRVFVEKINKEKAIWKKRKSFFRVKNYCNTWYNQEQLNYGKTELIHPYLSFYFLIDLFDKYWKGEENIKDYFLQQKIEESMEGFSNSIKNLNGGDAFQKSVDLILNEYNREVYFNMKKKTQKIQPWERIKRIIKISFINENVGGFSRTFDGIKQKTNNNLKQVIIKDKSNTAEKNIYEAYFHDSRKESQSLEVECFINSKNEPFCKTIKESDIIRLKNKIINRSDEAILKVRDSYDKEETESEFIFKKNRNPLTFSFHGKEKDSFERPYIIEEDSNTSLINPQILFYSYNSVTIKDRFNKLLGRESNRNEDNSSIEEENDDNLNIPELEMQDWFGYLDLENDGERYYTNMIKEFKNYRSESKIDDKLDRSDKYNSLYIRNPNTEDYSRFANNEETKEILKNYGELPDLEVTYNDSVIKKTYKNLEKKNVEDFISMYRGYYRHNKYKNLYKQGKIQTTLNQSLNNVLGPGNGETGLANKKIEMESLYLGNVDNNFVGYEYFSNNNLVSSSEIFLPRFIKEYLSKQGNYDALENDDFDNFESDFLKKIEKINNFYLNLFVLRSSIKNNREFVDDNIYLLLFLNNNLVLEEEINLRDEALNIYSKEMGEDSDRIEKKKLNFKKSIKENSLKNLKEYQKDNGVMEIINEYKKMKEKGFENWKKELNIKNSSSLSPYFAIENDPGGIKRRFQKTFNSIFFDNKHKDYIENINNLNYQVGQLEIEQAFKDLLNNRRNGLEFLLYYRDNKKLKLSDFFDLKGIGEDIKNGLDDIIATYNTPDWRFRNVTLGIKKQIENTIHNGPGNYSLYGDRGDGNLCDYIDETNDGVISNELDCKNFVRDLDNTIKRDTIPSYFKFYKQRIFPIQVEYNKDDFFNAYTKQYNRRLFGECTSFVHLTYPTFENLTKHAYKYCDLAKQDGFEKEQIKEQVNNLVGGDVFVWGNASQGGVGEYGHTGIIVSFECNNGKTVMTANECNSGVKKVNVDHANRQGEHSLWFNDSYNRNFFSRVFSCGIDPGAPRNLIHNPVDWLNNNSPYSHKVYENGTYTKTIGN